MEDQVERRDQAGEALPVSDVTELQPFSSHQTVVADSPGRGDCSLDGTGDVTPSSLQTVTELTRNSHQNVSINLFGVETEVLSRLNPPNGSDRILHLPTP